MSFHNLRAISSGEHPQLRTASDEFHDWLTGNMLGQTDGKARRQALTDWEQAPWARFAHPREEHLLPLHVCAGAAGYGKPELIYDSPLMGHRVAGFGWF
jgi:aromatic ring-opening dioxygenase catalytic subunit (LigB family)